MTRSINLVRTDGSHKTHAVNQTQVSVDGYVPYFCCEVGGIQVVVGVVSVVKNQSMSDEKMSA